MADASASGRADPAFDAHKVPIATWALAVWERWLPIPMLNQMMTSAIPTLRNAKRVWAMVKYDGNELDPALQIDAAKSRQSAGAKSVTSLKRPRGEMRGSAVQAAAVQGAKVRRTTEAPQTGAKASSMWIRPKAILGAKSPGLDASAAVQAEASSKRKGADDKVRVAPSLKRRSL